LNFRRATNKDSDLVRNLIFEILNEYKLKTDPQKTDSDISDIDTNYNNNNGAFEIFEDDLGNPLATVGLFRMDKETCELRKMYLIKSQRGKGYGKLILKHALENAKKLGYKKVVLETASVLKEAIELYKRFGFKPYCAEHLSERCDQAYFLDL
jgi:putative acetyltransferase